jgi:hypothetical protein
MTAHPRDPGISTVRRLNRINRLPAELLFTVKQPIGNPQRGAAAQEICSELQDHGALTASFSDRDAIEGLARARAASAAKEVRIGNPCGETIRSFGNAFFASVAPKLAAPCSLNSDNSAFKGRRFSSGYITSTILLTLDSGLHFTHSPAKYELL